MIGLLLLGIISGIMDCTDYESVLQLKEDLSQKSKSFNSLRYVETSTTSPPGTETVIMLRTSKGVYVRIDVRNRLSILKYQRTSFLYTPKSVFLRTTVNGRFCGEVDNITPDKKYYVVMYDNMCNNGNVLGRYLRKGYIVIILPEDKRVMNSVWRVVAFPTVKTYLLHPELDEIGKELLEFDKSTGLKTHHETLYRNGNSESLTRIEKLEVNPKVDPKLFDVSRFLRNKN